MEESQKRALAEIIKECTQKMGFKTTVDVVVSPESDNNIVCNINMSEDSNYLIGQHGVNLQALQHIVRLIVRKRLQEKIKFILDINSYRQQKNQSVIEIAREAAREAISERRAIVMKPMSTYERRLVHMELSKNPDIVTESMGDGENRKVIVKPSSML